MGEQEAVVVIARYLIMQELTASEGEQLIKRLSAFKMATRAQATLIPSDLGAACCLPSHGYPKGSVDEAAWADRALLVLPLRNS